MDGIEIVERDITPGELKRMYAGFDEYDLDNDAIPQSDQRFSYVAMDGDRFIGCVSCLACKHGDQFNGWCYLTDLFVEKDYRSQGIGATLLQMLEKNLLQHGITQVWTWTTGYGAPGFYKKQGYEIFAEMENWYSNGASRIGLKKKLEI